MAWFTLKKVNVVVFSYPKKRFRNLINQPLSIYSRSRYKKTLSYERKSNNNFLPRYIKKEIIHVHLFLYFKMPPDICHGCHNV